MPFLTQYIKLPFVKLYDFPLNYEIIS